MSMRRFNEGLLMGMSPHAADHSSRVYKKDSPPPDYTPVAEASEKAAQIAADQADRQLAFARQQYNQFAPIIRRSAGLQMEAQRQQMTQAKDYYDYNTTTFRPLEKQLVADASEFNTEAYRQRLANKAAADAGLAFNRTRQANERAMRSMGVNPNSGAAIAANSQASLGLAANRAAAMTGARERARDTGYARQMQAASLGRGLAGQSTAAYQGATNAGSAGAANYMAPGNQMIGAMQGAAGTMMQGQSLNVQGLSGIMNAQAQAYAGEQAGIGSAIGSAVGIGAGLAIGGSDRRMKENITKVGVEETTGLSLYEFNYIGPNKKRYRGVMADEVYEKYPDAVFLHGNGFMYVDYGKLGFDMQEVAP